MTRTNRVLLRPYLPTDAPRMAAMLTDPCIRRTYMIPDLDTPDALDAMFARLVALSQSPEHYERGISVDGLLIGFVNDVAMDGDRVELGYVIHPDHQGQGYATEALSLAVDELFRRGFRRVEAAAFTENTASRRVMEKCGFLRTGGESTLTYRGEERPYVTYALDAATPENRRVWIRPMTQEDRAFVMTYDKHVTDARYAERVHARAGYVILLGDAPVGVLSFCVLWDNLPFLNLLYLPEERRRLGIGRIAMLLWESAMTRQGYRMVLLSTQVDEGAQHFYRKLGYVDCGGLLMDNTPFDQPMELFMRKVL